ncbi:MAG: alpha-L-rhamnosidase, partial [Acidimicrobiales bacterium]
MTIRPYGLQCEHRSCPLGIGSARPLLSWKLAAHSPALHQGAYRVQVVSLASGDGPGRVVWDTSWQEGATVHGLVYAGEPLQSAMKYEWSVQVRDQRGQEGRAVGSWFETGLLLADDWQAAWIGRARLARSANPPEGRWQSRATAYLAPPCQLRKEFQLDATAPLRRARLYVSAKGIYRARLNGQRAGY